METVSLIGEDASHRGCGTMATTPESPSSGYLSTNDDDLSNDVFSASLGFDPSVGYGSCWLLSPYRGLGNELDGDEVEVRFDTDSWKSREGFGEDVGLEPEAEVDLGPEIVVQPEMALELELPLEPKLSTDFKMELIQEVRPGSIPEVESELEPEMSLVSGSRLLTDFLFCDWIHGSRPADRMFDDLISGDVFPEDEDTFVRAELSLGDPRGRCKESSTVGRRELQRRFIDDDNDEMNPDGHRIFSKDALTFDLDPVHPLELFSSSNRSISPLFPIDRISVDCCEPPEADRTNSSSCASPLEFASRSATPNSDFRTSCLDSEELFDVLLCEVFRHEPEADGRPEVAKPELVLVATPSASKRKSTDDGGDRRSRKSSRLMSRTCGAGISEGSQRIGLPVTLVATSSNVMQVTSTCARSPSYRPRNDWDSPETGETQEGRESRSSGEFIPDFEISQFRPEFPKTGGEPVPESERPSTKPVHACAKGTAVDACANGNAGDACAVGRAEVLAAMLQAEVVLREPNRGSDVIFAELRNGGVGESSSPPSVVPSSLRTSQRGATSLRSFLIRKQRDSSSSRQNLLHRLLKGETSEAEVRREQAASLQTTRESAVGDESQL